MHHHEKEYIFTLVNRVYAEVLLLFYVFLIPYLTDFYLLEPEITFTEFYFNYIDNRFYIFEIIIISLSVIAILCITGRIGVSILLTSMPMMLLAYAGSIKFAARNELIRLDDLKLTEAAEMAFSFLDFQFSSIQIRVIIVVVLFCICGILADILCRKFTLPVKSTKAVLQIPKSINILMSGICIVVMFVYGYFFIHSTQNTMTVAENQITNEGYDRFVLYNFLKNERNIDITTSDIEDSYTYFRDKAGNRMAQAVREQKPAVIVIMNESWWNTDNIVSSGISFSTDPMEPYHILAKQCSSGNLSSNIFGGGTISSETEFLTGMNTKYLLSDVGIYAQIRDHKVPSLVDYFHALDYDTTAIHPYYSYFYSRDKIYSQMGFDKVIFEDRMDYTEIYTRYISDESLVRQIIKEYEEDSTSMDKKKFIFAVSIANHNRSLSYKMDTVEDYSYLIEVTIENADLSDEDYSDFVNTINGIYLANQAFGQLVDYFEQQKNPVVIVMYGDHIPFFGGEVLKAMGLSRNGFETQKRQYSVPVLMWSNFNKEKILFSGENINYLSQIVLEYSGLPETDMTQILRSEKEMFRADVRRFVEDAQGQQIMTYNDEQMKMVRHINVIGYDILFGNSSNRDYLWFPHGIGEG